MNICAVIPALNEAETIANVVKQTMQYIDDVIVVDNNSEDKTAYIASDCEAMVIICRKRGVGITQYTGQQFAISKRYDYLLLF